ncbi:MAG: hypothetical protein AVDCRST_MAG68-3183 [uncultured Gemmatimonadetes bacterium]|uniref:Uncharacterized protein n=1 Tax=uncultured Gemmatimonadota bacterium TaxID=203437 RepID=A0A6J4LXQ5_9BACT|nr:MAG: hypothetical protein AVDCRST_MAG68-3183 [uncultured Gemmatimonadota bacterium]
MAQVVRFHVGPEAPERRRQPFQQLALAGAQFQLALPQQPVSPPQQSQRHAHPPRFRESAPRAALDVANAGPYGLGVTQRHRGTEMKESLCLCVSV